MNHFGSVDDFRSDDSPIVSESFLKVSASKAFRFAKPFCITGIPQTVPGAVSFNDRPVDLEDVLLREGLEGIVLPCRRWLKLHETLRSQM